MTLLIIYWIASTILNVFVWIWIINKKLKKK